MIFATTLYLIIFFSYIQNWLLLATVAAILFSIKYNATALIPVAILIDGYFGNFYTIPTLSILSVFWFSVVEFLRPKFIRS
jgi:hypothetical protein